jgi:hypothetical protein
MIHHFDPKAGQHTFVDQCETLFETVAHLRPAKAHLTDQAQSAGK